MGRVVLFLSPHLDDAVLSCPAYVQQLVKEGSEVRIATVFTESDGSAESLYRTRRAEDRKAARGLGAKVTHLGFPDAPFRSPRYRDFCGIVFGRAREYLATRRVVAREIEQLIRRWRPLCVVAPLAVGNHVDHRLVRDAALMAANPGELLFYEDRPYAFIREQVQHVLGQNLALRPPKFWRRYFAATYVGSYCGGTSADRIVKGWESAPPFPREYRLRRSFTVEIRPDALACALAAIRQYRTQIPDLFAGDAEQESLYGAIPETIYGITAPSPCPAS